MAPKDKYVEIPLSEIVNQEINLVVCVNGMMSVYKICSNQKLGQATIFKATLLKGFKKLLGHF